LTINMGHVAAYGAQDAHIFLQTVGRRAMERGAIVPIHNVHVCAEVQERAEHFAPGLSGVKF
jgi:hypothetical protein